MDRPPRHPDTDALLAESAWVRRLARRLLRDEHLAEDAMQEALAIALERRAAWDAGTLRRWLGRVTHHLALRWRDGRAAREDRERQVARPEGHDGGQAELERLRLHQRLVSAVMQLEDPYRSTLVLRFIDELEPSEIARRQGIAPAAARKRLSRGLEMLRGRLERELDSNDQGWHAALVGILGSGAARAGAPEVLEVTLMAGKKAVVAAVAATVLGASATWWMVRGDGEPADVELPTSAVARSAAEDRMHSPTVVAEDEPTERVTVESVAEPSVLRVTVVDDSGAPIEGADVLVVSGDALRERGRTGRSGVVELAGVEGGGHLVARAVAHPTTLLPVDALQGSHRLELARGHAVAGTLLVDGEVPDASRPLRLLSNDDPLGELHPTTRDELQGLGVGVVEREAELDAHGRFTFRGLPAGWTGELRLPEVYWIVDAPAGGSIREGASESLYLRRPVEGLVLRATRMPTVRGRIVWSDTGEGVADAEAWLSYNVTSASGSERIGATTARVSIEMSGRFEHVIEMGPPSAWLDPDSRPNVSDIALGIECDGASEPRNETAGTMESPFGLDLGEITLDRRAPGSLHFVVEASSGGPIDGAVVAFRQRHARTGPDGRGRLDFLPKPEDDVIVGAPGFETRVVTRDASGASIEDPMAIALDAGNQLVLRVVSSTGQPTPGMTVRVTSTREMFASTEAGWVHHLIGGSQVTMLSREAGKIHVPFRADDRGEVRLLDLHPGHPLDVQVLDRLKTVLLEDRVVTAARGEQLEHELRIPRSLATLEGAVRDDAGLPLPNVDVRLDDRLRAKTGSDGRYRFEHIFPREAAVVLTARLSGHVPVRVDEVFLATESRLPDLVLERGVELHVTVVDAAGVGVAVKELSAVHVGCPDFEAETVGEGRFVLRDLPPRAVTIRTEYGPHAYEIERDASQGPLRWELPALGSLTVQPPPATASVPEGARLRLRLTSVADPAISATGVFPNARGAEHWSRPLPLEAGVWTVQLVRAWRDGSDWREELFGRTWNLDVTPGAETRVSLDD